MFHTIAQTMLARMQYLEEIDGQPSVARDREDGTPRLQRLRQVPGFAAKHETGKFIALLAASAPEGAALEIGTSAGYSTLWIALGRQERGGGVTTFEILPEKVTLARETFRLAGVADMVELVEGDARDYLPTYHDIAFCFLDSEKELYAPCYEACFEEAHSPNRCGGLFPGGQCTQPSGRAAARAGSCPGFAAKHKTRE